ncbi:MAG: GntR family transcriptional regulator [Acidobacteria bacterium]|nr:MAG: GntR family transcriptional regulator [Acidobacteriota bacterium]
MKALLSIVFTLVACSIAFGQDAVTIYLAGDSTMAQKTADKRPETGWGEKLQSFFDPAKVRVENHAKNGRSTRSFIEEKSWAAIIDKLKKGDYVFIQFGHNDEKENTERYASPVDYGTNLKKFVNEVRARQGLPVLFTPVVRRRFDEQGAFVDTHGKYPDVVRSVAAELKVPLVDMHRKSEKLVRELGVEESRKLFLQLKAGENVNYPKGVEDNTHFNPFGAEQMAALAVEGIRESKLGLMKYLRKRPSA